MGTLPFDFPHLLTDVDADRPKLHNSLRFYGRNSPEEKDHNYASETRC